ncbi:hypothetical protein [Brachybacterium sacelli]
MLLRASRLRACIDCAGRRLGSTPSERAQQLHEAAAVLGAVVL